MVGRDKPGHDGLGFGEEAQKTKLTRRDASMNAGETNHDRISDIH
jgi:hypothetical protein